MRRYLNSQCKREKRPFFLVEILVALTLFSLLFCSLGFWQRHLAISSQRDVRLYRVFLQEHIAYKKLRELFRFTSQFNELSSVSLCAVVFDRGVYQDPELAGEVAAALHYNTQQQQLELSIHSLQNPAKQETFVLLDHVSGVDCLPLFRNSGNSDLPTRVILHIYRNSPHIHQERQLVYQFALGK